jgi:hypothetical protein
VEPAGARRHAGNEARSRHWPVSTQRLHPVLGVSPWPRGSSDQDVGRLRSGPWSQPLRLDASGDRVRYLGSRRSGLWHLSAGCDRLALLSGVVMLDNEGWSLYGAQRSQLVATGGKWEGAENGSDKRKPLPSVATSCLSRSMVRVVPLAAKEGVTLLAPQEAPSPANPKAHRT